MTTPAAAAPVIHPWRVVAGVFVILLASSGFAFYNLSVYMNALIDSRGFSVAAVSLSTSVFFVTGGFAGVAVGWLIQRFDPRLTMTAGALLSALALVLIGQVREVWQLYTLYVLLGVGNAGFGLVPGTTIVTRLFEENRSVALSIASTGLSVGGILVTPVSAGLIEQIGIPAASPLLAAALLLLVLPVIWLLIRVPHGSAHAAASAARPLPGTPYGVAVRGRFFVFVTLAFTFTMLAQVGGIAHLFNLAENRVSVEVASAAVSLMALCSIAGRFLGGWLLTFVPPRPFALCNALLQASGLALLSQASVATPLLAGAALFGAAVGNLLMLQPLLIAAAFGIRDYGRIFALSNLLVTAGTASGPLLLGLLHDGFGGFGGYGASYLAGAGAGVVGFTMLLLAGAPERAAAGPAAEASEPGR